MPGTQHEAIDALNAAGWALLVAYRNTSLPRRHLSVVVDGSFVDEPSPSRFTIGGLATPAEGMVAGRVVVAALEGDAT